MSDKPLGPGWWLASDGTWHPPEAHPSVREDTPAQARTITADAAPSAGPGSGPGSEDAPVATVELPPPGPVTPRAVPSLTEAPKKRTWSAESDRRADAGPMFPDLFEQALAGTPLAGAVRANSEGAHRAASDPSHQSVHAGQSRLSAPQPDGGTADVGDFTGASAKRRRWHL